MLQHPPRRTKRFPQVRWPVAAIVVSVAAVCYHTGALEAQPRRDFTDSALTVRCRAFLEAVSSSIPERVLEFLPNSGDLTYVHTLHRSGGDRIGIWRFPASDQIGAIQYQAPLWEAFVYHPEGQTIGTLHFQVLVRGTSWRRVRGTRFVPKGAPDTSAAFVEWRRENGRWVVSSLGDESFDDVPPPAWVNSGKNVDG